MTDALRILSTGAPKGGVSGCARAFEKATGRAVGVLFVTAPVLRQQVETGVAEADVIVGPKARIDAFEADGSIVPGTLTPVGSVKAGVVIRNGAAIPDLSSADSLKDAILAAQSIVYNVATSGQYIVQMMEKLGVAEAIEDRVGVEHRGGVERVITSGDRTLTHSRPLSSFETPLTLQRANSDCARSALRGCVRTHRSTPCPGRPTPRRYRAAAPSEAVRRRRHRRRRWCSPRCRGFP